MQEIKLSQGYVALVDDHDYERVNKYKWSVIVIKRKDGTIRTQYASGTLKSVDGKYRAVRMHRFIVGCAEGLQVDHIDGNGLNNLRENLRICSNNQNQYNQRPRTNGSSRFKGVSWHKNEKVWQATIKFNGRQTWLGQFNSEERAAMAYNEAARRMFGEFALLNIVCEAC